MELISAAKDGNFEVAFSLITSGVDLDARDKDRATPLYWSACRGHTSLCEVLVQAGCDVNARVTWGSTALHAAVDRNQLPCVEILVSWGADLNAQNNRGDTPLHISAYRGFLEIIRYLVRAGANALLRSEKDRTAQEEAASGGHVQAANFLLFVMEEHILKQQTLSQATSTGYNDLNSPTHAVENIPPPKVNSKQQTVPDNRRTFSATNYLRSLSHCPESQTAENISERALDTENGFDYDSGVFYQDTQEQLDCADGVRTFPNSMNYNRNIKPPVYRRSISAHENSSRYGLNDLHVTGKDIPCKPSVIGMQRNVLPELISEPEGATNSFDSSYMSSTSDTTDSFNSDFTGSHIGFSGSAYTSPFSEIVQPCGQNFAEGNHSHCKGSSRTNEVVVGLAEELTECKHENNRLTMENKVLEKKVISQQKVIKDVSQENISLKKNLKEKEQTGSHGNEPVSGAGTTTHVELQRLLRKTKTFGMSVEEKEAVHKELQLCTIQIDDQAVFAHCSLVLLVDEEKRKRHKLIDNERFRKDRSERKSKLKLEFVFYVKTDVSPYWSDAVLYRKSGFGTAKGYKQKSYIKENILAGGKEVHTPLDSPGREWTPGIDYVILGDKPINRTQPCHKLRSLVFLIKHLKTGRKLVLKMILNNKDTQRSSLSTNAYLSEAFSPENTVPKQLVEHAGVLKILHHYEGSIERFKRFLPMLVKQSDNFHLELASRSLFLVSEYFPQTLEQLMCDLKSCLENVSTFLSMTLYQLLSFLQFIQDKNIVHRNIACDNIFIDNKLCPVLGDVRFAVCLTGNDDKPLLFRSKTEVNAGDDCAWAPELVHFCDQGPSPTCQVYLRDIYSRSDVFALGQVFYSILTISKSECFYVYRLRSSHARLPPLPPSLPAPVRHVIRLMVAENPSQRLSARQAMLRIGMYLFPPTDKDITSQKDTLSYCSAKLLQILATENSFRLPESSQRLTPEKNVRMLRHRLEAHFLCSVTPAEFWDILEEYKQLNMPLVCGNCSEQNF